MKLTKGRWKGVEVARVPTGYLQWLASCAYDLQADLVAAILHELHDRHRQVLARYQLAGLVEPMPEGDLLGVLVARQIR